LTLGDLEFEKSKEEENAENENKKLMKNSVKPCKRF
jgi:hypothetical protein